MSPPKLAWLVPQVLLVLSCLGCAPAPFPANPAPRSELLSGPELHPFASVYDAIQALRSNWLQGRGALSCGCEPAAYVNGTRLRGIAGLREVPPGSAFQVRHLSARDATQRFGGGHEGGAIVVELVAR